MVTAISAGSVIVATYPPEAQNLRGFAGPPQPVATPPPRPGPLIRSPTVRRTMPATLEVVCENGDCELDMFQLHYTYDMPDEVGVTDFSCPYCGSSEGLAEVAV